MRYDVRQKNTITRQFGMLVKQINAIIQHVAASVAFGVIRGQMIIPELSGNYLISGYV